MKRFAMMALAVSAFALSAGPALAGWKTAPHGVATAVAKGTLTVTPGDDWNRSSRQPIKKGEIWTLDGETLNELFFVSGLVAGETLLKDIDKKNRPLPKMAASMGLTDIPEFFESTWRIGLNTSLFETVNVSAAQMGGHDAVRFRYRYSVQGQNLVRTGEALGTVVGGKLYLINFVGPSIFYFDRDIAKAQAVMASARF